MEVLQAVCYWQRGLFPHDVGKQWLLGESCTQTAVLREGPVEPCFLSGGGIYLGKGATFLLNDAFKKFLTPVGFCSIST